MPDPRVACVMLTSDRPALAERSVRAFLSQTYQNKFLYVYDNGTNHMIDALPDGYPELDIIYHRSVRNTRVPIGDLRNAINQNAADDGADIIVHWDDDDWSAPSRITDQVDLLIRSGREAVGYSEMLFWREPTVKHEETRHLDDCQCGTCGPGQRKVYSTTHIPAETWLFRSASPFYCCGTSLCYWSGVWKRRVFESTSYGEETEWLRQVELTTVPPWTKAGMPRMIARIHAGNTSHQYGSYDVDKMEANAKDGREWSRAPEWDEYCSEVMG